MIKKIEKLMIDILFLQICRFEFEKKFQSDTKLRNCEKKLDFNDINNDLNFFLSKMQNL